MDIDIIERAYPLDCLLSAPPPAFTHTRRAPRHRPAPRATMATRYAGPSSARQPAPELTRAPSKKKRPGRGRTMLGQSSSRPRYPDASRPRSDRV